jgi:hypothetical protein
MPCDELLQAGCKPGPHPARIAEQVFLGDDVQVRQRHRALERVALVRGSLHETAGQRRAGNAA